jgi:hypothetical protein
MSGANGAGLIILAHNVSDLHELKTVAAGQRQ